MRSSQQYLPPLYHVLEKFALAEQLFSLLVMEHPTVSFAIKTMLHAHNTLQTFHNTADPKKKGRTQCRSLPALCGVWGRVVFKPQALPTQMCRGWGSNPGPSGYRR